MKKLYLLACDNAPTILLCSVVLALFIMAVCIATNMAGIEFAR